jgi:hypothetical protein
VIGARVVCHVLSRAICHFGAEPAVVEFNGLLEVVNVNELNVELIVEVLNFKKNVSVGLITGKILKAIF